MGLRLELQSRLENLLGSPNVYFQPPENYKMSYPCIQYSLASTHSVFANNKPYFTQNRYKVIYIDRVPDSAMPKKIAELPSCLLTSTYISGNLNHYVFTLQF